MSAQARIPKYRADAKGAIKANMADCVSLMEGEISSADVFIFSWDDCTTAIRAYQDILTDDELARCFKTAQRRAA